MFVSFDSGGGIGEVVVSVVAGQPVACAVQSRARATAYLGRHGGAKFTDFFSIARVEREYIFYVMYERNEIPCNRRLFGGRIQFFPHKIVLYVDN